MRFNAFFLSLLPPTFAAHIYTLPDSLALAEADDTNACILPDHYRILNFTSTSGEQGENLTSFNFIFEETKTKVKTPCGFNSTSDPIEFPGSSTRYRCNNRNVEFIWQDEPDYLTMVEYVCPNADGSHQWEVAGTAKIFLSCPQNGGACSTNSTDQRAVFVSLNPARSDPGSTSEFGLQ
ncbi:hypothetical protein BGZ63DRAFT_448885 [Mariannaea sp. PMI_226]|nr:hypothetical protein BGZ63DRAFT_448885 [Mariannaea sp. PMI_226]